MWLWSQETENDWQEDETMIQAKGDYQEEDLEEAWEDMALGSCEENEGKESWEAAVEDSRANILKSGHNSLIVSSLLIEESVRHMDRIVNTESNGDHEIVAGHSVYCDAPEVEKATDIN